MKSLMKILRLKKKSKEKKLLLNKKMVNTAKEKNEKDKAEDAAITETINLKELIKMTQKD